MRLSLLAICALLAGCADEHQKRGVEKPAAPAMQTLDAYDAPTAPLTALDMDDLMQQVATLAAAVDALGIERTFLQSLRAGLAQVDRGGAPQTRAVVNGLSVRAQALRLPGEGYLEVWRICDGWGAAAVADPDNGELHLIAGFGEQGIDPIVWGTVSACRYRVGEHEVQLDGTARDERDGDVRMFIGDGVDAESLDSFSEPVVVELAAQATIDGRELVGALDFRIDMQTRALELLVPLGDGYVLVAVDPTRGGRVEARATNGTFSCELDALRCTGADGAELRVP